MNGRTQLFVSRASGMILGRGMNEYNFITKSQSLLIDIILKFISLFAILFRLTDSL